MEFTFLMSAYRKIALPEFNLTANKKAEWIDIYKNKISENILEWERDIYAFLLEWLNDESWIYSFTSGSTGEPKKIRIEKETLISSANNTIEFLNLEQGNNFLLCIPAKFIGGKMMVIRAILCEAELWITEPKTELMDQELLFDFAAFIPIQTNSYLKNRKLEIKKVIIGGAAISKALERELFKSNKALFWSTYGMTETVSHIALRALNGNEVSQYYTPFKNILIGKDERDCITIYHRKFGKDVIVTNDLIEFDAHQNFRVLGRVDNVINSGGLKIIPEGMEREVEVLIKRNVLIAGLADEKWGEKVVLIVEGEVMELSSQKILLTHLKELYGNKAPLEIFFLKQFIFTDSNKLNRKKTLALFKESIQ